MLSGSATCSNDCGQNRFRAGLWLLRELTRPGHNWGHCIDVVRWPDWCCRPDLNFAENMSFLVISSHFWFPPQFDDWSILSYDRLVHLLPQDFAFCFPLLATYGILIDLDGPSGLVSRATCGSVAWFDFKWQADGAPLQGWILLQLETQCVVFGKIYAAWWGLAGPVWGLDSVEVRLWSHERSLPGSVRGLGQCHLKPWALSIVIAYCWLLDIYCTWDHEILIRIGCRISRQKGVARAVGSDN